MRVAALYDIHGNVPALEAVLDDVRRERVDQIVLGGDVFPGPMAVEALELLLSLDVPARFLRGNGDRAVLELAESGETTALPDSYRPTAQWVAEQLTPPHRRVIAGWPDTIRMQIEGIGDVLFCHATPRNDRDIFTRLTDEVRLVPIFVPTAAALVVCGHTHMQFDRRIGGVRVVNAGSVGMPFGDPGAYWLLLSPNVRLMRTDYDLALAAERIRATAYPQASEFASGSVLQPPSEEKMLEVFAAVEVK
jgi:predicted phosphodiesterase